VCSCVPPLTPPPPPSISSVDTCGGGCGCVYTYDGRPVRSTYRTGWTRCEYVTIVPCTCSTNSTCLPTHLPPPPRIEFVSRATRAGTTNPIGTTTLRRWTTTPPRVSRWPYTGRSHTRAHVTTSACVTAFVLSRRGLITRWKRHAAAKNNRRNPVRLSTNHPNDESGRRYQNVQNGVLV